MYLLQRCLCVKESVCCSIAANMLTACIVDLGHTKTSISCVKEGQLIPGTSFHMNYGGDNISSLLLELLKNQRKMKVGCDLMPA